VPLPAVFALAFLARLLFVLVVDEPLLYAHQYTYFTNALRIAEHPEPLRYILHSDEWRTWDQHWTIAPLYHLFAAAAFGLFGPHLLPLRLLQCALDAGAAVAVAALGRQAAGPRGAWAGAAYALYWPAIEMPSWTMTENLHTVFLTVAVAVLAVERADPSARRLAAGGLLLGLSALARSVSTGFLAVVSLWTLLRSRPRAWKAAAVLATAGAAVILPWTARNVFLVGDNVLIESAAFENIWFANRFVDRATFRNQERLVHGQATPAEKRAAALHFALRGIGRRPGMFVEKIGINFRHFFRPEGLHNLVGIERSLEAWRHAGSVLLDDLPLLVAVPLFAVFLAAGRPTPARSLIVLWVGYYLFMVIVVFHNEIRYRSAFVPFAFAGAAEGARVLADPGARRLLRARLGLGLGLSLAVSMVWPYAPRAYAAIVGGDPRSPRPWFDRGKALLHAGRPAEALEAYTRGLPLATQANWRGRIALPRALEAAGRAEDAEQARRALDRLSWDDDPWLVLEIAWRELPAPRADEVVLGAGADYGAVRGFLHPRGGDPVLSRHRLEWNRYERLGGPQPPPGTHRWSRGKAWLRVVPESAAAAYDVTLWMGSPFPSPLGSTEVRVRVGTGGVSRVTVGPEIEPYRFRATAPPGQPLLVALETPTWSRAGEPADQGIRVDRMTVAPAP
jgi:4-amino-4-deoxy-L-arabinose transferase-like glycosyltransferase